MVVSATEGGLQRQPLLPGVACNRVLCWVNSIDQPDEVVPVARALTDLCSGALHVVMCLAASPEGERAPLTPQLIERAERRLAELYGEGVHTMVLPGHPVSEIRRYARNHRMDLIVFGGQGLAAERDFGERLCDDAPCSVMILFFPRKGK